MADCIEDVHPICKSRESEDEIDKDSDANQGHAFDASAVGDKSFAPTSSRHQVPAPASDPDYDTYVYEPLDTDKGQIRLVRVRHEKDPEIRCTIEVYETVKTPPYIALSYTWGDPTPINMIWVNGKRYGIRQNLYNFLFTFIESDESGKFEYLWIDQLCIDQSNAKERGHQVSFMAEIYRNSLYVISWLDGSSYGAMRRLKVSSPKGRRVVYELEEILTRSRPAPVQQFIYPNGRSRSRNWETHHLLEEVLHNRYFTRLWIVQEVLLANIVYIVCGNIWTTWKEIRNWIMLLPPHRFEELPDAKWLFQQKDDTLWGGYQGSLFDCIDRFSHMDCENGRDKVYGLLGLADPRCWRPEIDYNKSVFRVYLDTVRILLTRRQPESSAELLDCARKLSSHMNLGERQCKAVECLFDEMWQRISSQRPKDDYFLPVVDAVVFDELELPGRWWYACLGQKHYVTGKELVSDSYRWQDYRLFLETKEQFGEFAKALRIIDGRDEP
jgi:hypothetical protein